MEFLSPESKIKWNPTSKKWDLTLQQNSAAVANKGIPSFPYVYRVFFALESLDDIVDGDFLSSSAAEKQATISSHLMESAKFSRVASRSDIQEIQELSSVSDSILDSIDPEYYNNILYTRVDSLGNNVLEQPTVLELPSKFYPHPWRKESESHNSIVGWYTFLNSELQASYNSFDEAKETRDFVEYYLNSYTNAATNGTTPLAAGIMSVVPSRELEPGSLKVDNVFVGDIIRIAVSGGSGTHTVTTSSSILEEITKYKWRVLSTSNSPPLESGAPTLVVNDTGLNTSITLTINVEVPIDSLLDNS